VVLVVVAQKAVSYLGDPDCPGEDIFYRPAVCDVIGVVDVQGLKLFSI